MGRKILVIGGSGQTGRRLIQRLSADDVFSPSSSALNLMDPPGVRRFLRENRFDAILIPGAAKHIDWCQEHPEEATAANAVSPGIIAEEARGAHVVYFSTDAVFDGEAGPYPTDARPNPISVYGESKVEGERRVKVGRWTVVRTSHIFSHDPRDNFFMHVATRLFQGLPVVGYTDQRSTPTDADVLAEETVRVIDEGITGIVHLAGREFCSRYEFACEVANAFGFSSTVIQPGRIPNNLRPPRAGLVSHLLSCREGIAQQRDLFRLGERQGYSEPKTP